MSAAIEPDLKGAFLAWAQAQSAITAICATANIRGTLPTALNMPTFYLTAAKSGGYGSMRSVPIDRHRLDVWCYGSTPYEALRLARTVHSLLIPVSRVGGGGIVGFESAGCRVLDVQDEAGPREEVSKEGWPFVWRPYMFTFSEVALS